MKMDEQHTCLMAELAQQRVEKQRVQKEEEEQKAKDNEEKAKEKGTVRPRKEALT